MIRRIGRWRRRGGEKGFALVAVLLVMTIVGIIGAEFAYSMRLEASSARAFKQNVIGLHLAEAAVEQAVREIVAPTVSLVCLGEDGLVTFHARDAKLIERLPREKVPLGAGEYSYRISDEESRLNVNVSPPDRVDRLLFNLGLDKSQRDTIVDSIQDWRDADDNHRLNGAESDDTYLKLEVPYRAHNANIESIAEMLQIKGVTPAIFNGAEGKTGLKDFVTVKTPGQVNLNTAPPLVLRALGLSDAEISDIVQTRRDACFVQIPGRFGGRGLVITSRTFRIEAQGIVDGEVRARVTAIVQKDMVSGGAGIKVLEWSGVQ